MPGVVSTSRVSCRRTEGRRRRVEVPGAAAPLEVGVHGVVVAHYGLEPGAEPERASTLDLLVAAATGRLAGTFGGALEARQVVARGGGVR